MSRYREVLNNLTAGEERNVSRQIQYDSIAQRDREKASYEKLQAIKQFSTSLDGYIKSRVDQQIEDDKERGKLLAIEEDFESQEAIGTTTIDPQDEQEYYDNKKTVLDNKKLLNETANEVVEQGGSYQDSNDVSNLSGWALYSYVQQKSKIAADNYEDWLKGEMNNNEDLELEHNGVTFTPSTAETLQQKQIALKALRRKYIIDNELLDVNRSLLNDKDVGFYDKVQSAHKTLTKEYETEKDIDDGIRIRTDAIDQFIVNKDFALLLSEIKRTVKPDGSGYNRKEALDETFKILKDLALTGDITVEELEALQEQEVTINGETYKAGRWRKRWAQLAIDITQAQKDAMDAVQNEFEMQGDNYIMDIQAKEAELQKEGKRFSEKEIDEMIANWDPRWGKVDSYLTDLKTRSTEDGIDDDVIKILEEKIKNKQPIYQTDVNKITDSTKWAKWTKVAKDVANQDLIKAEEERRDQAVKGVIETAFFDKVENPKGTAWRAANTQATEEYNRLFELERPNHETSSDAHDAVMKELKPRIEKGDFNVWDWDKPENATTDQTFFKNKKIALAAVEIDSNIIKDSVIPGTEEALKTYITSKGKTVSKMYEDLARSINKGNPDNPISPSGLAYLQAKAAGNDVENIKSEIDKEIDELPKHVKQTLLRHPDQYKVARAKLELLKEDGDISYNDIEYLIDEVIQMDIDKDNKTKPINEELKPRIGDWKDIKGIGYVVWDGEEWLRKGNKGRYKQPYLGNVENYRDIDNYVKPYDGVYKGEIPLGAWYKLPNAIGYAVWDGQNWVRSGNKTRAAQYEGEVTELIDVDGEVKKLY